MKRTLINCAKIVSTTALLNVLVGCSLPIGPAKPLQMYAGPAKSEKEVSTIYLHSTKANPSNVIEKLWGAGVLSIDGVPANGYTVAYVLPGKHKVKMYCWHRNSAIKKQEVELEFTFYAGGKNYPWSTANATAIRGSGAAGAMPGTIVGDVAAGYCSPHFGPKDPDM